MQRQAFKKLCASAQRRQNEAQLVHVYLFSISQCASLNTDIIKVMSLSKVPLKKGYIRIQNFI